MSEDMELCLAELRFRKDFVVIYRPRSAGDGPYKRTPALALLDALDWYRALIGQDPHGRHELAGECRSVMAYPVVKASGAELVN